MLAYLCPKQKTKIMEATNHTCCCHQHKPQPTSCCCSHGKALTTSMAPEIISLVLLVAGMVMGWSGVWTRSWMPLTYYLVAIAPVAWLIVTEGISLWRKADFLNEFTLMTLAAIGAFAIGEYPEAVAVLLFYSFGEKLNRRASDDVRRRIRSLISRMPATVTLCCGTKMSPEAVEVGKTLLVSPGERVAIDGVLIADHPIEMDTSALTGESVPRSYDPGQEVPAGVIPIDHQVKIRTTRPYSDSTMSRMMHLIDDAAAKRTPTETMLRRITRWFTPAVVILAVSVFVVPALVAIFTGTHFDALTWFRRALVFFVCSCPCALVVSIPLSYFATLGNTARRGLLFKGASHIDVLRDVDTVVFDKTGTITTGRFHLVSVSAAGCSEDELLALAAAVDAQSSHPLAQAICKAERGGALAPRVSEIHSVPHGMRAIYNNVATVLVGSRKLLESEGIDVPAPASDLSEICVARDGSYLGSIYLADTVKEEASEAISQLHKLGIGQVCILSGDRPEAVASVADAVGADSYRAGLLPEEKYSEIERLKADGRRIAFVGDGINDAPALARADIGVAMGTLGTDMAMESADVVVAGDNLLRIPEGIRLARRARRVVFENVIFAFSVKGVVMTLAAFGLATLWAGVFADTGVTLLTILWTLLRLRH